MTNVNDTTVQLVLHLYEIDQYTALGPCSTHIIANILLKLYQVLRESQQDQSLLGEHKVGNNTIGIT